MSEECVEHCPQDSKDDHGHQTEPDLVTDRGVEDLKHHTEEKEGKYHIEFDNIAERVEQLQAESKPTQNEVNTGEEAVAFECSGVKVVIKERYRKQSYEISSVEDEFASGCGQSDRPKLFNVAEPPRLDPIDGRHHREHKVEPPHSEPSKKNSSEVSPIHKIHLFQIDDIEWDKHQDAGMTEGEQDEQKTDVEDGKVPLVVSITIEEEFGRKDPDDQQKKDTPHPLTAGEQQGDGEHPE